MNQRIPGTFRVGANLDALFEPRPVGDERVILALLAAEIEAVLLAQRAEADNRCVIQFAANPLGGEPAERRGA